MKLRRYNRKCERWLPDTKFSFLICDFSAKVTMTIDSDNGGQCNADWPPLIFLINAIKWYMDVFIKNTFITWCHRQQEQQQRNNQSHTSKHQRQDKQWSLEAKNLAQWCVQRPRVGWDRTYNLQVIPVGNWATSGLYLMFISLEALLRVLFETEQRPCATHLLSVSVSVSGAERGVPSHLLGKSETRSAEAQSGVSLLRCPAGCFEMISQFVILLFNKGPRLWQQWAQTARGRSSAIALVSVLLSVLGAQGHVVIKRLSYAQRRGAEGSGTGAGGHVSRSI